MGAENWHTHLNTPDVDLIYSLCNDLPTEFKVDSKISFALPNSLKRFGAEIVHRSQANSAQAVRRTWGGFTVYPEGRGMANRGVEPYNNGLVNKSSPLYAEFLAAGTAALAEQKKKSDPIRKYYSPVAAAAGVAMWELTA